mmetsp:Transcript_37413/g.76274  ORF Transcript_37413/g.76274 Transcript_37413/m.76274 type:complete len:212 (-) Transcript_37413:131-766(-)
MVVASARAPTTMVEVQTVEGEVPMAVEPVRGPDKMRGLPLILAPLQQGHQHRRPVPVSLLHHSHAVGRTSPRPGIRGRDLVHLDAEGVVDGGVGAQQGEGELLARAAVVHQRPLILPMAHLRLPLAQNPNRAAGEPGSRTIQLGVAGERVELDPAQGTVPGQGSLSPPLQNAGPPAGQKPEPMCLRHLAEASQTGQLPSRHIVVLGPTRAP